MIVTGGDRRTCWRRRRRFAVAVLASALLTLAIGPAPTEGHRPAPNNPIILQTSTSTTTTPFYVHTVNGTVLTNGNYDEFDAHAEDGYNSTIHHHHHKKVGGNMTEEKAPLFPEDLFTVHQRRRGAVILHVIGVVYMFVALAIVCDEFFVPSLDVIIEKLEIADDVAGATFMAAGGSAPELFTSIIGVFVSFDDVGIGTIVGSAVFNILFVIGMCAIFSRTVLSLTWWPLFRDCTFYSASLLTLIYFFRDNYIYWYEALVLFGFYLAYVSFMKWNQPMEKLVKRVIYRNKVTRVRSTDQLMPSHQSAAQALQHPNATNSSETSVGGVSGACGSSGIPAGGEAGCSSRGGSSSGAGGTAGQGCEQAALGGSSSHSRESHAKFRHGLLQLMIHTIDPLHDGQSRAGKVDEKATQLHAIASLKVLLDATRPHNGAATSTAAHYSGASSRETTLQLQQGSQGTTTTTTTTTTTAGTTAGIQELPNGGIAAGLDAGLDSGEEDEPPEALDMGWPSSPRKRLTYILVAPILFPLWLTLPDTRTPRGKKFFAVTFIGSIFWIAAYSYLMVWWANIAGDTVRIPPEVMGLTFLAAGTSIPDLITSVIVARKGFGDMAVSSSVGSNIFDVTVGLPVPWLLYGLIYGKPVEVNSVGMVCSIAILFCMLLFVIMSIACFKWRMNKGLGFTMFLLYFVFVAVSLMFEYEFLVCPA
ncbi:sodium/potassium/calcium exchanger Nckx30C isoform X1 [Bombus vosnesenskii]|uniref:Sodium/potassium/calcium exchanger Nckx30C isoform X1 n=2 Tax=Pyrobombus TaxID=144703 RepID=A0A6J3L9R2_9HYME|nr:sodium/potassium/calcium exchanger Nckx30C isoform X1 [Bombus vancouverensis nearcticus]XP_033311393.1 sodium/potassium/calcium exchanger Nckx30C isoform X1 [Bombus bifarius]XP_033361366.1 sodium/potassium/calcium exchanger Nckx30C isoform X1 [Bombus vosnesenskii]XP_050481871.1 sodium/potassium/calcium exchanger Nckx30C isoform X1 [Bombus huntii]